MKAWKYRLEQPYQFTSELLEGIAFENAWVTIKDKVMTINTGYAWDGCSPKRTLLGLISFGTPDGISYLGKPWLYHPSLVHDVFCQFKADIPVNKELVVEIWRSMLMSAKWPLTKLYVFMVDTFGPQKFKLDKVQ